jgi:hypothetical protein
MAGSQTASLSKHATTVTATATAKATATTTAATTEQDVYPQSFAGKN